MQRLRAELRRRLRFESDLLRELRAQGRVVEFRKQLALALRLGHVDGKRCRPLWATTAMAACRKRHGAKHRGSEPALTA